MTSGETLPFKNLKREVFGRLAAADPARCAERSATRIAMVCSIPPDAPYNSSLSTSHFPKGKHSETNANPATRSRATTCSKTLPSKN
jgi:hypothetical protein